ncbi:MAG: tRNA (N(6)-L-threonylcarbamoyladenosine(37)-C(2))-methylthiotransferase MtaB [Ruminococcus sp.]|nr:tRNA (N(6)-L-threonylcarbamoyladenosine(37)-C(2))-methylthiotransferase MtaB [Ruminococcus sp.]
MRIYYYTFGCKVNQYETENLKEKFALSGHSETADPSVADVLIVNSCTVTAAADSKCRQFVRRLRKVCPDGIIVLCGCLPQAAEKDAAAIEECDILAGTAQRSVLPELVENYMRTGKRMISIMPHEKGETFEKMTNHGGSKTRAYIKIQDGCDCFCTYCIIPHARGHVRSKPLEDIVSEAADLISAGHRELILTGINLCFYGRDLEGKPTITDAAQAVCALQGDFRVRLGSIEPELISDRDIERLAGTEKFCPHFHLSLQSGCSATLERMHRRYDGQQFERLCEKLRKAFPGCALTTDIMVGFPGETAKEFEESVSLVKRVGFSQAHIFPYSKRPGTPAALMEGQVSEEEKRRRAGEMSRVCGESRKAYLDSLTGKVFTVLFERENSPLWHRGHAEDHTPVKVPRADPETSLFRCFRPVRITGNDGKDAVGEFV